MSADKKGAWVGTKFNRKEDHRLTTGKGKYLADMSMPDMLHLTFLRSERAHATINSIDKSKAEALPGIIAVFTGEDIKDKILPLPQPVVQPALPARFPKHWPLAVGKVKFHGEAVVAIVSRDKYVGAETLNLAVMGCIVNGPGESKHADIGISLPGTGEEPAAPVFVDGKKTVTLRGTDIADQFQVIVDDYVENRYERR